MLKQLKKLKKRESGQAMVEFALVLPILLLLLCGIVDFGWIFYNQLAVNSAAREGARYASVHYMEEGKTTALANAEAQARGTVVDLADMTVTVTSGSTATNVTATVTADVPFLTGLTGVVLGKQSILLTGECTMRIEY